MLLFFVLFFFFKKRAHTVKSSQFHNKFCRALIGISFMHKLIWSTIIKKKHLEKNISNSIVAEWTFRETVFNLSCPERAFQDICDRGGTVIEEKAHGKHKTNRRQSHTISRSRFFLSDFLSIEVITKNVLQSPRGQTSVAGFPAAFISATDQLKFWNLIVFMFCVFVLLYFILFIFCLRWKSYSVNSWQMRKSCKLDGGDARLNGFCMF